MNLKTLSIIIILITIATSSLFAKIDTKAHNSYFYSSSYEGFAGYCAVITEELSSVSRKMKNRLNISSSPKHETDISYTSSSTNQAANAPTTKQEFSNFVDTVYNSNTADKPILNSTLNFSNVVNLVSNESNI